MAELVIVKDQTTGLTKAYVNLSYDNTNGLRSDKGFGVATAGPAGAGAAFGDGLGLGLSASGTGRIRYNDTTKIFEQSLDGGTYLPIGTGVDVNAIHDNVAGEISAITEKLVPIGADLLIVEDSAAGNAKKRVQIANLPFPGSVAAGELVFGSGVNTLSSAGELAWDDTVKRLTVSVAGTRASSASADWDAVILGSPSSLVITGTTTIDEMAAVLIGVPAVSSASAVVVSTLATLEIEGPPIVDDFVSVVDLAALRIKSGVLLWTDNAFNPSPLYTQIKAQTGSGTLQTYGGITFSAEVNGDAVFHPAGGFYGLNDTYLGVFSQSAMVADFDNKFWFTFNTVLSPVVEIESTGFTTYGRLQMTSTRTLASGADILWNETRLDAVLTLTGSTNETSADGVNAHTLFGPTILAASALTITHAATLKITGPVGGGGAGPATITNPYALWIDAGNLRYDNPVANGVVATVLGSVGPTGASTTVVEWAEISVDGNRRIFPLWSIS